MVFNDSQEATSMSSKILKIAAVMEKTGIPRTTLYARISADEFPRPISLGARAVGWLESEVDTWLESRARGTAKQRATDSKLATVKG
jgi:prophage regulatory protein